MPLITTLGSLRDRIRRAKIRVGSSPGPLSGTALDDVKVELDGSMIDITNALNDINNAGTASTNIANTLPGIAADCDAMAEAAYAEANGQGNQTVIGNNIKTIQYQIDATNGYRDLAGIT